jgi:hypothetical protein
VSHSVALQRLEVLAVGQNGSREGERDHPDLSVVGQAEATAALVQVVGIMQAVLFGSLAKPFAQGRQLGRGVGRGIEAADRPQRQALERNLNCLAHGDVF